MTRGGRPQGELWPILREFFPVRLQSFAGGSIWGPPVNPGGEEPFLEDTDALTREVLTRLGEALAVWDRIDGDELPALFELAEAGLPVRPWLTFEWDGFGPSSSAATLELVELGSHASLVWWTGEMDEAVLAAVVPCSSVAAAAFLMCARPGGEGVFWADRLLNPPARVRNHAPSLTGEQTVADALWRWLSTAGSTRPEIWRSLRDEIIGQAEQPDHLRRSLEALVSVLTTYGPCREEFLTTFPPL